MPDGAIEFHGRKDDQVKINGYRVELGEIQAAFKKCGLADSAVILPIGDQMASKKIIAFIKTSELLFSEAEIKERLKAYLPGYFIPEKIIVS